MVCSESAHSRGIPRVNKTSQSRSRRGSVVVDVWGDGVCPVIHQVPEVLPWIAPHAQTVGKTAASAISKYAVKASEGANAPKFS
ncbi:uncharacterized protein [Palaemon carinicauda]